MNKRTSFWDIIERNRIKNFSRGRDLQSICLRKVINCFERFHLAYENSTDIRVKQGIEFLQRKHSSYIATELSNKDALKDKYFGIIINKYLRRIDNLWFKTEKERKVAAEKIKEIGHTIEYFHADHFEELTCIDILKSLPNLKHFIFRFKDFTTEILETLHNHCNNLETLEISNTTCIQLSQEHLKGINLFGPKTNGEDAFPNLKSIKVMHMDLWEEDVKYLLRNLRALEVLNYPGLPRIIYSMHRVDFKNNVLCNVKQYNLSKLSFYRVRNLKDTVNICASVCPNVREICTRASQEHVDAFSKFSNLEVVKFYGLHPELTVLKIEEFLKIRGANLTSLCIKRCKISCDVILKYCMKLQKLTLYGVIIECGVIIEPYFSSKFNLEELCLISMDLGDPDNINSLKHIFGSSHHLQVVTFSECEFFDDFEPVLLNFCKQGSLEILNIHDTEDIYKTLTDILLSCPSLKTLTIRHPQEVDLSSLENIANIMPNKPFVDHGIITDIESESFSYDDEENYLHRYGSDDCFDITDDAYDPMI